MPDVTPPLPQMLLDWLPRQRWFPAKGQDVVLRRLGGIRLPDPGGKTALAVHIVAVHTGKQAYVVNVPVSLRDTPLEGAEQGLIGELNAGGDGASRRWLYDGAYDPLFVAAWLEMMRSGTGTRNGLCRGHAGSGFERWPRFDEPLKTKVLAGEQSNTSVVVETGRTPLIVKFFRVLEAGANPDVEIGARLSELDSADVPATYGWVTGGWLTPGQADDDGADPLWDTGHLSVLREFIPDSEDAWRTASSAAVANEDFTAQARGLGAVTGRIHRQLRQAFGSRSATREELAALVDDLADRIRWGWAQAGAVVGPLDEAIEDVLKRLAELPQAAERPELQRIHADYHLGQVLHSKDRGWVVLDFEGEPLRPLDSRGTDDVALRDVVGMLRSFDYAAGVALLAAREDRKDGAEAAAAEWAAATKAAFIDGYEAETGSTVDTSAPLFVGLWLDKALYEVVYEQRNRPQWVEVPVQAVRHELERISQTTTDEEQDVEARTGPKPNPSGKNGPAGKNAGARPEPAAGSPAGLEPVSGAVPGSAPAAVV
ncbi:1,4-alpha-glucan branching enzyme, partial [Arthrobacter sp. GCM10027362]